VLLITCLNIANLLLAKGAARQRELAIRSFRGSDSEADFRSVSHRKPGSRPSGWRTRDRTRRGTAARHSQHRARRILPSEANFQLDIHVLTAALAATTLSGLLFGCAPAWYASRVDPGESLKDGGRSGTGTGSHKLRRGLIIGEFGLALSLLAGAGLAIHSFWNLTALILVCAPIMCSSSGWTSPMGA